MKLVRKFSLVAMMVTCALVAVFLIAGCGDSPTAPLLPKDNGEDSGGGKYAYILVGQMLAGNNLSTGEYVAADNAFSTSS